MNDIKPIFLISLPRSGSTLLQKILAAHPDIFSVTEPWLLLPFGYLQKPWGLLAPYDHEWAMQALENFIETLPSGQLQYYSAIREFVLTLYQHSINDRQVIYFLDKTPRYYLIVPFLAKVFPDAKYIFLFRNPLSVFSSILTTWLNNDLKIYRYFPDLYYGPPAMAEGYRHIQQNSIALQYQDLVSSPDFEVKRVCKYLDIDYDSKLLMDYRNVKLDGMYGDKTGVNAYNSISTDSLDKWKTVFNTVYRRRLAKNYVRQFSDLVLSDFGTSVDQLIHEIDSIACKRFGNTRDIYYHFISNVKRWLFWEYFKYKLKPSSQKYKFHH